MATLRAVARLLRVVGHVLHGLVVVLLSFPRLDVTGRHARIQWWAAKMLRLLGIGLQQHGAFRTGGTLLLANHVSWLDIVVIHAVCPRARFVSKADVRHWPLLSHLVDSAGTLYIERERKRDAMRVVHQIAEALQQGDCVAVFPEGTTGDGLQLLPFHANLLQAAIATETPVQPVALRFSEPGHPVSPAAAYVGDTTLLQSLWHIARARGLQADVRVLPALATRHAERRALAERVREQVAQALAA